MLIKMDDEQIVTFLEKIKPKIKKELLQTSISERDDLEQEMMLLVVEFLKEKEFEEVDFFELLEQK